MTQPDSSDSFQPDAAGESPAAQTPPVASASAPRGRFRLLRALVWLLLLGATVGFWFAARENPRILETVGGWISSLTPRGLSDAERKAEEDACRALRDAGALVVAEDVTAAKAPREDREKAVTSVDFKGAALSDDTLKLLKPLVRLTSLNLTGTDITDERLRFVAETPSLASLVLNDTPITDAGLARLAPLKGLDVLHLRNTRVGNEGLAHLAAIGNLKVLDLSETQVTDDGLAHLARLQSLNWLLLEGNAITDAGLQHLHALKGLRRLTINNTKVTPAGVAAIGEAIPGLVVNN